MAQGQLDAVLRHIRRLVGAPQVDAATDQQLLERFVARREQSAFAVLVKRHGPMVLGVCRRVLRNDHDAEDAFQATFLVLARKAGSQRWQESVGGWLYEVACRVARKARVDNAKRQFRERKAEIMPSADPLALVAGREIQAVLEEELCQLPEKYRLPVVLCCLEGASRSEAARQLGWKEGTVAGRLARARSLLQRRLACRGVTVPASLLAAALAEKLARAAVPAILAETTLKVASQVLAGQLTTAGVMSTTATAWANEILRVMYLTKLKSVALVLAVAVAATGSGLLAHRTLAGKQEQSKDGNAPGPVAQGVDVPNRTLAGKQYQRKDGDAPGRVAQRVVVPEPEPPRQVRTDLYGDPLPAGAVVRMGTIRLRYLGHATATFSADGKTLISSHIAGLGYIPGSHEAVRFWDAATGEPLQRKSPETPGGGMFSPDGRILVTREESELRFWDVQEGKELRRIPTGKVYTAPFAWAADGKTMAAVIYDDDLKSHSVHLWDVDTGKEYPALEHKDQVHGIALSPDGQVLASVSGQDTLRLFEIRTSRELHKITEAATGLAFSADGKTLASGDSQGTVKFWDAVTGQEQAVLSVRAVGTIFLLRFSPDSRTLAVAGYTGLSLCDVGACKELYHMPGLVAEWVAFAPDGKTLVSCGGGKIQLWDVATGKELLMRPGHGTEVDSVAFAPDGKVLASASSRDGTICLWESATGRPLHLLLGHEPCVRGLSFSADGKLLVSGGGDGILRFWDVATGKELRKFAVDDVNGGRTRPTGETCRLSPDGRRLVAISHEREMPMEQIDVWDTATGSLLTHRAIPIGAFTGDISSSLSPDGKSIAIRSAWGLALQDIATGRENLVTPLNPGGQVAFSADGKILAATFVNAPRLGVPSQGVAIIFWELATSKELSRLDIGPVGPIAFSPDGRLLATAGLEATRLWEVATGKEVFRLPRHADFRGSHGASFVSSLAFSPDGKTLATGFPDGTILTWDLGPGTW